MGRRTVFMSGGIYERIRTNLPPLPEQRARGGVRTGNIKTQLWSSFANALRKALTRASCHLSDFRATAYAACALPTDLQLPGIGCLALTQSLLLGHRFDFIPADDEDRIETGDFQ